MSKVIALFEQYVKLSNNLHYDAMLAAVRVEDPGKLADTIASHLRGGGGGEAEPPGDLLAPGAPEAHPRDPGGRGREAAGRQAHPGPRQEADGAGPEGVLPQREDEGDPEGAGSQGRPRQRGRGAPQEDRARPHAQGGRGPGAPGAEAAGVDAAHVGRGHRLPQLPGLADRGALVQATRERKDLLARGEDPERGPLRAGEGQGAHRRVPGRAPAREEAQGADPLLRGPARRGQDLAGQVHRPRHQPQVRAPVAWAACATRPRSAATAAPTSAPSPARSSR